MECRLNALCAQKLVVDNDDTTRQWLRGDGVLTPASEVARSIVCVVLMYPTYPTCTAGLRVNGVILLHRLV